MSERGEQRTQSVLTAYLIFACRRIHWLSLDVALGAAFGVYFFESLIGPPRFEAALCVASAAWSVYLADHLLDLRRATPPLSPRRAFHARHRRSLCAAVVFSTSAALILSIELFSARELLLGAAYGLLVLLYLIGSDHLARWGLKELSGALLYSVALALPALLRLSEGEHRESALAVSLSLVFYLTAAALNLSLFALLDREHDQAERLPSLALGISPDSLHRILIIISFVLCGLIALPLLPLAQVERWGLSLLCGGHFLLTLPPPHRSPTARRQLADLFFWFPGLSALIGELIGGRG